MVNILEIVRARIKRKYAKPEKKSEERSESKKSTADDAAQYEWTCTLCNLKFPTEEHLKKHHKRYHKPRFGQ